MSTRHHTPGTDTILAVDLGTGGPKTALVLLSGHVVDFRHRRIEPRVGADGSAVQDPEVWWKAVTTGTRELVDVHPEAARSVVAVAVTGQWGSTVPVDAAGQAVGDCMLWMDTRGGSHARALLGGRGPRIEGYHPRALLAWVRRAGGIPSLEGNDPLGHRLWIEYENYELYKRAAAFVEPLDYLNARFCGRLAASQPSMILSWLTDNRSLNQVRYDPTLLRLARTDSAKLPPLVATGATVGRLGMDVARQLGVPDGIPVVTALPDLLSATLGSGAIGHYQAHLSISTSSWVGCHAPAKRTSAATQMATVPSALSDRYVLANNHDTSGLCLEWAQGLLVHADDGLTRPVAESLADLDAVAATSPSGSGGVLFAPWLNGERSPVADAALRAGFHNLSLATTRAHLVRSVLEGVAHNNRWLLEASERALRHPLVGLRAIGGGAVSDLWCQIHADVLDRPVERVSDPLLANLRGAAFFAGISLGLLNPADVPGRVRIDRTFSPDPASRKVHDSMHAEFVLLPKLERGLYHRLASLG